MSKFAAADIKVVALPLDAASIKFNAFIFAQRFAGAVAHTNLAAVADIADTPPAKRVADIGNGVAVSFMDRSTVYDRELTDKVLSIADKNGVKAQIKRYVSGGNDAGAIHKTAEGVKTVTLSVPTRYLHSPASVANINDYFAQRDLCVCILKELV